MLELELAEDMYEYCRNNNLGIGVSRGWAIKHFELLIDNLNPGEKIYSVFIGLHNYHSMSKHAGNFAYAVTNKRILMAQHKILGSVVQSVSIENINDITVEKTGLGSLGIGTVCIDSIRETITVGVNVAFASNIYNCVHGALAEIKGNTFATTVNVAQNNNVQQLKDLKELLDMGIITQDEFDLKKKQILGI